MTFCRLLTIKEAATYLGVSIPTLRSWCSQRKIPFIKMLNRRVAFDFADLCKFVEESKVVPRPRLRD